MKKIRQPSIFRKKKNGSYKNNKIKRAFGDYLNVYVNVIDRLTNQQSDKNALVTKRPRKDTKKNLPE